MFALILCLVGFAAAAPAILDEPIPSETHMLVSPYIAYPGLPPLRALKIMIEPEPKEEDELPKEELFEENKFEDKFEEKLEEKFEEKLEEKLEEPKPTVVKLDVPKPPQFISNFFANLPFNLPHIPYLSDWLASTKYQKLYYPAYYPGYAGAVFIEPPKV